MLHRPPQAETAGKSMSGSVSKRFVAIGHVVNDSAPEDHLGGGVAYSAVAARRLGYEAHVITKCSPDHRYVADLKEMGVHVHPLPTRRDTITSFDNTYDGSGRRKQHVAELQESISLADFPSFPQEVLTDAIVLVAPVVGEVDVNLYPALARSTMLAVTPQGYFRKIDSDGTVLQRKWEGFEDALRHARVTVFSDEDVAIVSENPDEVLETIGKVCPLVALTLGPMGVLICEGGKSIHVGAFPLADEETNDLTGAGDTFAAALITELARGIGSKAAAVSAAFFAALKIAAKGRGIGTIPTLDDVERFRTANQQRVQGFLKEQNIREVGLFS
jgi:sugar/nucleoside kinase (ribokinase family)